ncbi:MAG: hypothetical protein EHM23_07685 [Acidobacteria bacterium]|nr:MAG: hypothetical protein EHM23_07685 [Acidobacteriota bacterium]
MKRPTWRRREPCSIPALRPFAYSAADRRLARSWSEAGVSLTLIEHAILLGCGRKYVSWLNGQKSEPIGSLAFFEPVLEEISRFELSLDRLPELQPLAD